MAHCKKYRFIFPSSEIYDGLVAAVLIRLSSLGWWSSLSGRANPIILFLQAECPQCSGVSERYTYGGIPPAELTWPGDRRAARGEGQSRPDERSRV